MANKTEIGRKAKIVDMTTTAIGFTGDFKLARGIRNLYDKILVPKPYGVQTLWKKTLFCKRQ